MGKYLSVCRRERGHSRWMITMRLFVIFFLFTSTFAQDDECPANPNSPSCDDPVVETICQLTCERNGDCVQADEDKCGKIGVDVSSEHWADMFSARCKEICETSRDAESPEKACRFYKVSDWGKEVVCSLMDDTPIPGPHFGCDHCNPYSDETCEEGNKCFTIVRRSEWEAAGVDPESSYWRKLAIECTRFGTWDRLAGSGGSDDDYIDILHAGAAPTEPNCKPQPVEILPGVLSEEGADFLCDNDLALNDAGTHYEIVAPNTCVLLCD